MDGPGPIARIETAVTRRLNDRGIYLGRRSGRMHAAMYRRTGGRLGGRVPGYPDARVVLVDHVGAKSGMQRASPLMFVEEDGSVVVAAAKAGQSTHPAWFHNLTANPDTTVQLGREVRAVRARVASHEERERIWPRFVAMYPGFETFAERAGSRAIPLVILEPR